jgi:REP element-mobilizing transposase RayT
MSHNYKFPNPDGVYFISFAVVEWLDVLTRNEYKNLLVDCLRYCQKKKGMEIFTWCIMTNHVHLIFRSSGEQKPELLIGDFKRFTSKALVKAIIENLRESRKEFLLEQFLKAGNKSSNVDKYQFWRYDNKPIELWSNKVIDEKNRLLARPVRRAFTIIRLKKDWFSNRRIIYIAAQQIMQEKLEFWRMLLLLSSVTRCNRAAAGC